MFNEAIIAQQLVVDVERAMAEGNTRDARLLADELTLTADHATELLAALSGWPQAESAAVGIAALMDLGSRAGIEYHSWFNDGKRAALRNARALRTETPRRHRRRNNVVPRLLCLTTNIRNRRRSHRSTFSSSLGVSARRK